MTADPTPRPADAPPEAPDTPAAVIARLKHAAEDATRENHAHGEIVRFVEDYFNERDFEHAVLVAVRTLDAQAARIAALEAEVARLRGALEAEDVVYIPDEYEVHTPSVADMLLTLSVLAYRLNDITLSKQASAKVTAIRAALTPPAD